MKFERVIYYDLESEVRRLRNRVFLNPISDESWEQIKQNWMEPKQIEWLRDQVRKQNEL